ncbi:MAG TPA: hypothetical protein DCR43_02805 [Bacteroidales bacterium]|nr:MAG: hypothetical protein A2X11_09025 [Bacteroidetes bacterium GWE2_42_24]OFY26885.1 MAG: hypothetical protein A2X09_11285 [Bacteroidetes bacterium GWF2_43_11]HAQ64773.1 hypothetical protein [Bacteroidales bacterium]HBZ67840.1 hypothetical protein [Bacteroidales bacterium]
MCISGARIYIVSTNQTTGKMELSIQGLKDKDFIIDPNDTSRDQIAIGTYSLKLSSQRVMRKKGKPLCSGNQDASDFLRAVSSVRSANRPRDRLRRRKNFESDNSPA